MTGGGDGQRVKVPRSISTKLFCWVFGQFQLFRDRWDGAAGAFPIGTPWRLTIPLQFMAFRTPRPTLPNRIRQSRTRCLTARVIPLPIQCHRVIIRFSPRTAHISRGVHVAAQQFSLDAQWVSSRTCLHSSRIAFFGDGRISRCCFVHGPVIQQST